MTSPQDFLMGRGGASARWPQIGSTVTGTIAREPDLRQQTEYVKGGGQGAPKFFKGTSDPMMQLVVQLQTAERDAAIGQDNGMRNVYVKGKQLTAAVRGAVQAAGAPGLEVGGTLSITWTGGGPRYLNDPDAPAKEWAAQYTRPTSAAANAFLADEQAAPAAPTQPAYAAPAAPLPPLPTPAAATPEAIPAPTGVDPAAWGRLSADQQRNYLAQLQGQPVG
jgi:hypothetical protein